MMRQLWSSRLVRVGRWILPGAVVMESNCATEFRDTVVSAIATYIGNAVTEALVNAFS